MNRDSACDGVADSAGDKTKPARVRIKSAIAPGGAVEVAQQGMIVRRDPTQTLHIAIASGKGGSGKTTIALHLAWAYARSGERVVLCDCDADAPNLHCFLPGVVVHASEVTELHPRIDAEHCVACGACVRSCAFDALYMRGGKAHVAEELCHGCGVCALVCPSDAAISEHEVVVGTTTRQRIAWPNGVCSDMVVARARIGNNRTPRVIADAIAAAPVAASIQIRDCAPGCACAAVAGMRGADCAVLVAEATPFGLHDLKLAVEMTRTLGIPLAVVVNRSGAYGAVEQWCTDQSIAVLACIPDDRQVAEVYASGRLAGERLPDYNKWYQTIRDGIDTLMHKETACSK
ncbi:MAG: 4Fe-4S binding protein [Planctomycetota bacterium]|nr:4Fe-4S binding protein [Planctomycetota bacterium]